MYVHMYNYNRHPYLALLHEDDLVLGVGVEDLSHAPRADPDALLVLDLRRGDTYREKGAAGQLISTHQHNILINMSVYVPPYKSMVILSLPLRLAID